MDKQERVKKEAVVRIEKERLNFKQLIAVNPDYSLKQTGPKVKLKANAPPVGNTKYEELTCVGFNPDLNLLEATIQIKLPYGFLSDLCKDGSTEYVRFFIDYNDGSGWQDVGYSALNSHDIPNIKDCANHPDKPLSYTVTQTLNPKSDFCKRPVLPLVRAILSWESLPTGPNYPVVWGNALDRHIQIKKRDWFLVDVINVVAEASKIKPIIPPLIEEVQLTPIPLPDPPEPLLKDLVQIYQVNTKSNAAQSAVEPHRFGLKDIQSALAAGSFNQQIIHSKIEEWKSLGINWAEAVAALEKTSGNVSYEELKCLGLEYNLERLVATFQVKKTSGYSGDPCGKGSFEYISFWADWDNTCQWTYLDTVSVNVHDYSPIPADGLNYSAVLKVNLEKFKRNCSLPKIARIRAVLSWNTPPSKTNPDAIPYWGNRVDAHVQLKPGQPAEGAILSIIGGIGVADINIFTDGMTKSGARFALTGSFADPWNSTRSCPFGGKIVIQGPPMLGLRYRILARQSGVVMVPLRITNSIRTVNQFGVGTWRNADADDAFTYLSDLDNIDDVLAWWSPKGDELWEIRLQVINSMNFEVAGTVWHKVQLDNTKPDAQLTIDGGACDKYTPGTIINGHFVARDIHFGVAGLQILPASLWPPSGTNPNSALPVTSWPSTVQTPLAPGAAWTVNTNGMKPCGYVVRVNVYDNTILNSSPGQHNYDNDDKGFCLLTSK